MAWPTTQNPRTKFVTVRLTEAEEDALLEVVEAGAARDRSTFVREAVLDAVKKAQKKMRKGRD